jgi:hypothetical protein
VRNVAVLLVCLAKILLSNSVHAQSMQIPCPVNQVNAAITPPLPTPWWYTPTDGGLASVHVSTIANKTVLVCEYSAFGGTVSVMRDVPANANTCKAGRGGFECVSVQPPSSVMGPLTEGIAYLQSDLYSSHTKSAQGCAAICASDQRCRAMTFVKSQHLCWIKNAVPASAPSSDMISAVKQNQ